LATALALLLGACSVAGPRESPLPHDGPTLVEVYREHIATEGFGRPARPGSRAQQPAAGTQASAADAPLAATDECTGPLAVARDCLSRRPVRDDDADLLQVGIQAPAPTLDAVLQRFQRLPNPDLVMYVFPHLARGRYPVPGYYTAFPLYETVEYALPGELPQRLQRATRAAAAPDEPGRGSGSGPASAAGETAQAGRGR
jgi:conjugative transfer region lipoprotein (TIGR03751 family)